MSKKVNRQDLFEWVQREAELRRGWMEAGVREVTYTKAALRDEAKRFDQIAAALASPDSVVKEDA